MSTEHEKHPELTAIAIEFGNRDESFMVDCIFPGVKVCSSDFKYRIFDETVPFNLIDQKTSCKSLIKERDEHGSILVAASVQDYAQKESICPPENCGPCGGGLGFDEEAKVVKQLVADLRLGREMRGLQVAFDAANFAAWAGVGPSDGGLSNWSPAPTNIFTALSKIMEEATYPFTHMAISRKNLMKLARHPDLTNSGVCCDLKIDTNRLAALLGLEGICVGDARINMAAPGLTPNIQPIVGDQILLFHKNNQFQRPEGTVPTFGVRFFKDDFVTRSWYEANRGLKGVQNYMVGVSETYKILAPKLGHLITNVSAALI